MQVLALAVGACAGEPESPQARVEAGAETVCDAPVEGFGRFTDTAAERGVDRWLSPPGGGPLPGIFIGGLVATDVDADGDVDLMFNRLDDFPFLYENDGTGRFAERAAALGPYQGRRMYATGAVDIDGDRLPEVFRVGASLAVMAKNLGGLQFGPWQPIYEVAGYPRTVHASMAFGDVDGDGDLDLALPGLQLLREEGITVGTGAFEPGYDVLLENLGGSFRPIKYLSPSGPAAFSFVHAFTDRDNDGDLDLVAFADQSIGNARPPAAFWRNDGPGEDGLPVLVNDAPEIGADVRANAMGMGANDLNGDGFLDYCVSDDAAALTCLMSDGDGGYYNGADALGLRPALADHPTIPESIATAVRQGTHVPWVTWGLALVDLDNDRWLDLAVAAGPTLPGQDGREWQPDWLWRGTSTGNFQDVGLESGLTDMDYNYGLVAADLDGDGYREIVSAPYDGAPAIWDNPCGAGAWLEVDLVGPAPNAEAYGSRVIVTHEGRRDMQEVYNVLGVSQGPPQLHFGLGDATKVDRLEVHWIGGAVTILTDVPTRRKLRIVHPEASL